MTHNGDSYESVMLLMDETVSNEDDDYFELRIRFEDSFRYMIMDPEEPWKSLTSVYDDMPYHVAMFYTYDRLMNVPVAVILGVDITNGYLIAQWENQPEKFLLVSESPDTGSEEILRHFQLFLDRFSFGR